MDEAVTAIEEGGLPVACSLAASELARRGETLRNDLFAAAEERRELDDGYAYRFPGSEAYATKLLEFAAAERTCCSFFRIELAFEPGPGPIWLTLRGPEGTKAFIQRTFDAKALVVDGTESPEVATVEREELKGKLARREPITILEAMPEPYYRKAHLPGALNMPVERIEELAPRLLPDKEAEIVVYCANLPCPNSGIAARALSRLGYRNVRDYAAGKQDWQEAGFPTERGQPPEAA